MRLFWLHSLLAACGSLFISGQAHAQPLFGSAESLEHTVVKAEIVVVGKIVQFDRETQIATIAVEETLKGNPSERLNIRLSDPEDDVATWKMQSSRLLVAAKGTPPIARQVFDLTAGELEVMTADFTVLRKPEDVFRIVKETVRRLPEDKKIGVFNLAVPREAFAGTRLGRGYSHIHLSVPVDERLEKKAIEYIGSKSYRERKEGVRALALFKSDENTARMKSLLGDPEWEHLERAEGNNGIEVRLYEVRNYAHDALQAWGVKVEKPAIRVARVKDDIEQVTITLMNDEIFQRLSGFKNLRELYYHSNLNDEGLKKVAGLKHLERLTLGSLDNSKVSDAGIKELKELTSLTSLDLHCANLTDAGLRELAPLTKLTTLDLTYANIAGSAFKELAGLKNLTRLHLHSTKVGNAGLKELAPFTNLTILILNGTRVTDAGLKELAPLQNLTRLHLLGAQVTDAGLRDLAPLRKLNTIDVYAHTVTDTSLRVLREINLLHALVLATGANDSRPKSADEVVTLELGRVSETKVTDAGLKELVALTNLTHLSLPETITVAGLKQLAQLKNLTTLFLGRTQVADADLKELAQVKKLSSLYLPLTDARMRVLREIGLLHTHREATGKDDSRAKSPDEVLALNLRHSQVFDEGYKELASLENLAWLSLDDSKVTDAGLRHLAALPKLRELNLSNTQVTDAGLRHLEGLSELRELSVANSKVTVAGVVALRTALPKCRITTKPR